MNAPYNGFRALGEVLGGSGAPAQGSEAYMDGMMGGYKVQSAGFGRDKAREEARIARSKAVARDALGDAARAFYKDPELGDLAAALFGSANTPSANQLGKMQVPTALPAFEAAAEAADLGNVAAQNQQTALATGKPYEPYSVAGGGDILLNAGTGETQLTDLGQAVKLAQDALAGSRQASGAASRARADLTERTDPNRPRGAQPKGKYTVGQVIEVGGKKYRVTGGDLNDPDVEEIP